jgi:hypothetical protein
MTINGYALEEASSVEVIAAYAAPMTVIQGVTATPGWYSVGMFFLSRTVENVRLEVIGLVSQAAGLTMNARLFSVADAAVVSGSGLQITANAFTLQRSGKIALTGQRSYLIQAECVGGNALNEYGIVKTATVTD